MQKRHTDYDQYIAEQTITTEKYVIPYINNVSPISNKIVVAEIGCGQGGNLKPFVDLGCKVVGVDISANKIAKARAFFQKHAFVENVTLIQDKFLAHLKEILREDTKVFIGFPPWYMPFAGHQQVCKSRFLSKLPYFHLFPKPVYKLILKLFGEPEDSIEALLDIKDTRISINRYRVIIRKNGFSFLKQDLYLVNPNYEIKFKLKPKKLPAVLNVPYLRDFFTTTYYSIVKKD